MREATKVSVIGSGKMGRGFAKALVNEHEVVVGSRDSNRALMLFKLGPIRVIGR